MSEPVAKRYLRMVSVFDPDRLQWILADGMCNSAPSQTPGWNYLADYFHDSTKTTGRAESRISQAMVVDGNTYLPGAMNTKVDRASMSVSLEVRCPFQDHKVVELAYSLPASWRLHRSQSKLVLRHACRDLIPPQINRRSKRGFSMPVGDWFRGTLRQRFADTVLSDQALARGYFRGEALKALLAENDRGAEPHGHRMWALMTLELWHRKYIDIAPRGSEHSASPRVSAGHTSARR